jgi:protease I
MNNLDGRRVLILAENDYEDLELWYPLLRLKEEGATVTVAGTGSSDTYKSKHGYPVKVDTVADNLKAASFDAVIIPGGWAPDRLRRYPAVLKLVREAYEAGKVVASICHGGWVPASAGILKGRKVTCVSAIKDDLINAGATYLDQEVVKDGRLITSRVPSDLPAFLREIILTLKETERR